MKSGFLSCLVVAMLAVGMPGVVNCQCVGRFGQVYELGEVMLTPDPCESGCVCEHYGPECMFTQTCSLPRCVDPHHLADNCCATCPNGPNCSHRGGILEYRDSVSESHADPYCSWECSCLYPGGQSTCIAMCS